MKKWNVYRNSAGTSEAVKDGFNWWAFLFTGVWAFFASLPWQGVIGVAVTFTANRPPAGADIIAIPTLLILMLVYGFMGNGWVCARLEKRGYKRVARVEAASREGAKAQATGDAAPPQETPKQEKPIAPPGVSRTTYRLVAAQGGKYECEACKHHVDPATAEWDRINASKQCPSCGVTIAL